MGLYINPSHSSHEQWFINAAVAQKTGLAFLSDYFAPQPVYAERPDGTHWVVYIDNGPFVALGVAYDEAEFQRFARRPGDDRPMLWLAVPDQTIIDSCPEAQGMLA